jgi:hypothetical protein
MGRAGRQDLSAAQLTLIKIGAAGPKRNYIDWPLRQQTITRRRFDVAQ